MKVQLSPWEILETSVNLPAGRRRKLKNGKSGQDHSSASENDGLAIAASFVAGRRPRHSKRAKQAKSSKMEDLLPALVLTSEHRITMIGKKGPSSQGADWQESGLFQHASRPGKATSFIQPDLESSKSQNVRNPVCFNVNFPTIHKSILTFCLPSIQCLEQTARIPAVFDAKHEEGYVLQNGNSRLLCWPAAENGSETPASKLTKPAVSLSLLTLSGGKSIVFGTLQDRSLYLGRRDQQVENGTFAMQYVAPCDGDDDVQHVGTVSRVSTEESGAKVGSKRNAADSDHDRATIYQLFVGKHTVSLVRHEIDACVDGEDVVNTLGSSESATISLIPPGDRESTSIDSASMLEFFDDNGTVTILYSLKEHANGKTNGYSTQPKQCYATVSLEFGELTGTPVEVASSTRQAGLVGPSIMAVWTSDDELFLYDTARGAQIHHESLQDVGIDTTGGVSIITDPKRGRLAIIFVRGEKMCVALSSVKLDGPGMSEQLSLAAGLASSMEMAAGEANGFQVRQTNDLATIKSTMESDKDVHDDTVPQAISMLDEAFHLIRDGSTSAKKPSFLLDAYNGAVALMITSTKRASGHGKKKASAGNPQDAITSKKGEKLNGIHNDKKNGKVKNGSAIKPAKENLVNGQHGLSNLSVKTPGWISSTFVEHVTSLTIQILLLPGGQGKGTSQDDASEILRRLIRTRKVSVRSQFRSDPGLFMRLLRSLEPAEDEKSGFTPVDFIFDMFLFCFDISERQLVTMLHYMLARARPCDVAAWFIRQNIMNVDQSSKRLAERYVSLQESSKLSVNEREKQQQLSAKLILAGTKALLLKIIAFSDCNETLLRGALGDSIPPRELGLLNQVLLESVIPANVNAKMSGRAMYWASALCDRLRGPGSESEGSSLTRIRKSIAMEISKTECLMSLQATLQQALVSASTKKGRQLMAEGAPALEKHVPAGQLPSYQIERLAF
jgi:hypothetical protein